MNIFRRFIIIFNLLTVLNAGNTSPLYNSIQSNLGKYRQSISKDDFSFRAGIIRLVLECRRTNIKSQLLLGFYSVGIALQRMDLHCLEIEILIRYEMKEVSQVSVKSPVDKVLELSQGKLSPEQFLILIGY